MNFGEVLEALKDGKKVARRGWNGKGMFLVLTPGITVMAEQMRTSGARDYYRSAEKPVVSINSHIDMKAADDTMVIGWLASQTDMLADDWEVIG